MTHIKFRLLPGRQELGECKMASMLPPPGAHVLLHSQMRHGGMATYRVVTPLFPDDPPAYEFHYADNGARRADEYVPGIVWVNVEELPTGQHRG